MNLWDRYRRLSFWNKFGIWGASASIIGLVAVFWPSSRERTIEVQNSPKAVVNSPQSINQNISDSPGSVNVAAGTVIFGDPPLPEQKLRESFRTILKEIHPTLIESADRGVNQVSAYISRTHVEQLEKLGRQQSATNFLALLVHGPGPFVLGSGNSGPGIWDQLQDGVLMKCTVVFKDGIRNPSIAR